MATPVVNPPFQQPIKCRGSISQVANNLAICPSHLAYVSRNEVHVIPHTSSTFSTDKLVSNVSAFSEKDPVAVGFVRLGVQGLGGSSASSPEYFLVATSLSGVVQLLTADGSKLLGEFRLSTAVVAISSHDSQLRGIDSDGKDLIFIGGGSGEIFVFSLHTKHIILKKRINCCTESISDLRKTPSGLLAVDDLGGIYFLDGVDHNMKLTASYFPSRNGVGYPATSLALREDLAIVSYASGHIRIFHWKKKELLVEIAAHSRPISALALHPSKPLLAAVSEDAFVSVWSIPTAAQLASLSLTKHYVPVQNLAMRSPQPVLLAGVQFAGKDGEYLLCSGYDCRYLHIVSTVKLLEEQ